MRKIIIFILLLSSLSNINADIINKMLNINNEEIIKLYDFYVDNSNGFCESFARYYAYLYTSKYINNHYLYITTADDTMGPNIMAYKIYDNKIVFIIKHWGSRYVWNTNNESNIYVEIKYIFVELYLINDVINWNYYEIEKIDIEGFIINNSYIYLGNNKLMKTPSLDSEVYKIIHRDTYEDMYLDVIGVNQEYCNAEGINDFWYKINYENEILWMHGGTVYFENVIIIK